MWNVEINNSNVNSFYCFKSHQSHLERLFQAKSKIDDKGKKIPYFLSKHLSKRKLRKDILEKINNENYIIFNKMLNISEKNSPYSLDESFPIYCPAFDKKKFCFDKIERNREINKMNNLFYKRFLSIKPTYSAKNFLKQYNYKKNIENRIKKVNFNPNLSFVSFNKFRQNVFNELIKNKINKSNSVKNFNEIIKNDKNLVFKRINLKGNLKNNDTNFNNSTYSNYSFHSLTDRAKSASFNLRKKFV